MSDNVDIVTVTVPNEYSVIETPDGHSHIVAVDTDGRRTVTISAEHARVMLNSGLPCSIPWKQANAELAERLGPLPKPEPGLHIASYLRAQAAIAPRSVSDRGGAAREVLRALGRLP
jgi:hypothetical protein